MGREGLGRRSLAGLILLSSFAGGIGLCGGACGALGAAIWIQGMKGRAEGASNKVINARISDTVERFQQASDYAFECTEIVGRRFESLDDHARHMREGGCSAILEALATDPSEEHGEEHGEEQARPGTEAMSS